MALSSSAFLVAEAVPVSNTALAATRSVPDNCHTVIVYNPSTTTAGLIGQVIAGTLLVAGQNAVTIPAGASLTLAIGTIAQRGVLDFGYGSAAVGPLPLQVLYLCSFGPI